MTEILGNDQGGNMITTAEELRKLPCVGKFEGNCRAPLCPACQRYVDDSPGNKKYFRVLHYCGLSNFIDAKRHPEPEEEEMTVLDLGTT
jgi:hypothetical protein